MFTVSVEKAVATNDGGLVAFCLRNSPYREICCEPWYTPMYVKSMDEGQTWSEAKELTPYAGRVYDARYYEGNIYVLEFCNDASDSFVGSLPEHQYRIYISKDQGETFEELCVVPFPSTLSRGYGSMIFREDGSLIVYAYNKDDEEHMDYIISYDLGKTWTENGTCYLAKKIRNPQTALLDGTYILHGRAGAFGFVIYTSKDGIHWSEGFFHEEHKGACYYSGNLVVGDRLLIQFSDQYDKSCVNISHMWLQKKK